MKIKGDENKVREMHTWEEESGLISFLSSVEGEVERFNEHFEFSVTNMVSPPSDIDGDAGMPLKVGFVLKRENRLLPEVTYCLYSLLKERVLYGYIGICRDGRITTLKQLKPIKDFRKGKVVLYDWLRQLIRASFEKIIL